MGSFIEDAVNVSSLRDIRGKNSGSGADLSGNRFEMFLSSPDENDVCPFARERQSTGSADSSAGASYDGNFSIQTGIHAGQCTGLQYP
jgi:hypothetical protein